MKRTTLVLILNLFLIGFLKAQNWEVGGTIGLNHSFQSGTLTVNGVPAKLVGKYGYELGVALNKKIGKRFYLNTGLGITKRSYGEEGVHFDSSSILNITSRWTDLTIPIQFNYRIRLSEKLTFSPTLGLDFGVPLYIKSEHQYKDGRNEEFKYAYPFKLNPKYAHVFLGVGFGMMYKIDNRFSVLATPKISADINFANLDNLNNVSLNFTLLYTISKKSQQYVK